MIEGIIRDKKRFREIIHGKARENLKEYIKKGAMAGIKGKKKISIPMPSIDLPRFRHGQDQGGVGSGEGNEGDIIAPAGPVDGEGSGEAGKDSTEHEIEVDVNIDELLEILEKELELPRLEDKGKKNIIEKTVKYTGIWNSGPDSLRHRKRTFKRALKREIAMNSYDPKNPIIIPVRQDKKYRGQKIIELPVANAVIFWLMDVSGSMGDEQKEIVRVESFWMDKYLSKNYDGLEARFITHDAAAREVDRQTFFTTRESGGTMISSAYKLCADIIRQDYNVAEWNIYVFHFSDGDNWSGEDSENCLQILKNNILPAVNLFGYGQVKSPYGSGAFIKYLERAISEKVIVSEIDGKDGIFNSIQDFLKPGK